MNLIEPFSNLKTKWKLIVGFCPVFACLVFMLLSTSSSLYGLLASQETIFHSDLPATYDAMVLCNNLERLRLSVQMMTLVDDDVARYRFFDDILQVRDEHKTIVERLRQHLEDKPQTKQEVSQLRQIMQEFETSLKTELQPEALQKASEEGRNAILASQSKRFKAMSALAEKLQTECQKLTKEHTAATISKTQSAIAIEQIVAAATILVAVLLMVLLQKTVSTPLQAIGIAAKQIATGDLNLQLSHRRDSDEIGEVITAFEQMACSLKSLAESANRVAEGDLRERIEPRSDQDVLVTAFATMVNRLAEATAQINEAMQVLATVTCQIVTSTAQTTASASGTAAALAQTTATVEEIKIMARMSNDKANLVSTIALTSSQYSSLGSASTQDTIAAMKRVQTNMELISERMVKLAQQNTSIGEIITLVDELSIQSNLLALNAAIEAAKAGEYGAGFAVVAKQMRSLAAQSKGATEQVRSVLNDIEVATTAAAAATTIARQEVQSAVEQSVQTGASIKALSDNVTDVASLAQEIAISSNQQMLGIDQSAIALVSIHQASSQNLFAYQQIQNAAQDLNDLSLKFKSLVDFYKL